MAIDNTESFSGPYLTNGATTVFPFTFVALVAADVAVILRDADGVATEVSGFTVAITPGGGGSVTFAAPPASGFELFVLLEPEFTQQISFENGSAWLAEPVNEVADRSALRDLWLKGRVDRALKVPFGEAGPELGSLVGADGKALGVVGGKIVPVPNDVAGAAQIKSDVEAIADAVEIDAQTAADARVSATNSRVAALAAQLAAEVARAAAEAAADGAEAAWTDASALVQGVSSALAAGTVSDLVGTRIYTSRAALNADLVPGDGLYALVIGDATPANNDLYKKSGATGTGAWSAPLGFFASASAVAAAAAALAVYLSESVSDEFAILDGDGQQLLSFDAAGRAMFDPQARLLALFEQGLSFGPYLDATGTDTVGILDALGQRLLSFDSDGRMMADPQERMLDLIAERVGVTDEAPAAYPYLEAPIVLVTFYGQSLSLGLAATGRLSSTSPYPNVIMPDSGVQDAAWTDAGGAGLTGYVSLATDLVPLDASVNDHGIEAPVVAAGVQLAKRMRGAQVLVANAGRGGYGIAGLKKGYNDGGGSGPYALLTDQFDTYSGLAGAKPIRSMLCWMQGEADANNAGTSIAGYKADLLGIRANYGADTGQGTPHLFVYQLSSHTMRSPGYNPNPGLALDELGAEQPDVSTVLPLYFLAHTDGVHLTAQSARLCGAYFGRAVDHVLRTGENWKPLRPSAIARSGAIITVTFEVPVGSLIVDTDAVSDPGSLGFEVFNSVGGAKLPIDSVYVYGNKAIITLASVPANPVIVGYALGSELNGSPAGPTTGPRGCLRDEDDTRAWFDTSVRLRNWCVMFKKGEGYGA